MTVIVRREEITVLRVANIPNIDPGAGSHILGDNGRHTAEHVGRCAPARVIADVRVGGVGGVAVLEDEVPEAVRFEVEDLRSSLVARAENRGQVVEGGGVGLTKLGEAEVYEVVIAAVVGYSGEDMVRAIHLNDRGVLDGNIAGSGFRTY